MNNAVARGDHQIFIEKPFGGHSNVLELPSQINKKVNIGYVLRFNPCIQWVKRRIGTGAVASIDGQYLSDTISKKPKGWRNGPFSGVLNEMGSHVLDLVSYLIGDEQLKIIAAEKNQ